MSKLRLHLDADISIKALQSALIARGHDVTRTPNAWVHEDASDEAQLLAAMAHGRCIVTYNVRDFLQLAGRISDHAGIILVTRPDWTFSALLGALDRLLSTASAEELVGQVRWLSDWR
ncbi:MAG: DUF5615 family PIN-like protein [Anaerolineae bacterium]